MSNVSSEPKISAEPARSVRTMVVCWGTSIRSSVSERRVWRSPLDGGGLEIGVEDDDGDDGEVEEDMVGGVV